MESLSRASLPRGAGGEIKKPLNWGRTERPNIDFIERWFGFSPDGGDGSTEMLYVLVAGIILALLLGQRHLVKLIDRWYT